MMEAEQQQRWRRSRLVSHLPLFAVRQQPVGRDHSAPREPCLRGTVALSGQIDVRVLAQGSAALRSHTKHLEKHEGCTSLGWSACREFWREALMQQCRLTDI
jgi:hypothetical protein